MRKIFARITFVLACCLVAGRLQAALPPCNVTLSAVVTDETCPTYYDGAIDLTVTGSTGIISFTWSTGDNTEDINSLTAGTYTVSMIDANGCTAFDTITVAVAHAMTCDLGNDTTLCDITNYVLDPDAPGATFYYWFANSSQGTTLTVSDTGTYVLYVQNTYGCGVLDTIVLAEYPVVNLDLDYLQPGCGASLVGALDLTVIGSSGPYVYDWSNGAHTEDIGTLPPGNYIVTVTDANSCAHVTNGIILPRPDLSDFETNPTIICSDDVQRFYPNTFGFADNGNHGYVEVPDNANIRPGYKFTLETWVRPLAVGGGEQVIVEKRILSGDGIAIGFNPNSREIVVRQQNSFNSVFLNSHALLQPGLWTHIAVVSDSATTSLWINGVLDTAQAYTGGTNPLPGTPWTIGGGNNRVSFAGLIDEVRLWDFAMPQSMQNEFSTRPISAGVNELKLYLNWNEPRGGLLVQDHSPYGSQAYFVNADTNTVWQLSNPFGLTFLWAFGDGAFNNSQSPLHGYSPGLQFSPIVTLTVSTPQNCQSVDSLPLTVHTPRIPFVRPSFNAPYCIGDTVDLIGPGGYVSYLWSNGSTNDSISCTASGVFHLTADDGAGCIHHDSTNVVVFPNSVPIPVIDPVGTTYLCPGDTVVIDVGQGYASYLWSTGATTQSISVTDSGSFYVTVANGFGCARMSDTSVVVVLPSPSATISQSQGTLQASAGTSYQWYLNGQPIIGAIGATYTPTGPGTYTVLVGNAGGCEALSAPYNFTVGIDEEALAGDLAVFPNPTHGATTLRFSQNHPILLELQLTDLQGRILWKTEFKTNAGQNEIELPTNTLPAGAYFLKLQSRKQQVVRMISKI